jgi:ABC-type Na+ transport system ATPase subunit NatA
LDGRRSRLFLDHPRSFRSSKLQALRNQVFKLEFQKTRIRKTASFSPFMKQNVAILSAVAKSPFRPFF